MQYTHTHIHIKLHSYTEYTDPIAAHNLQLLHIHKLHSERVQTFIQSDSNSQVTPEHRNTDHRYPLRHNTNLHYSPKKQIKTPPAHTQLLRPAPRTASPRGLIPTLLTASGAPSGWSCSTTSLAAYDISHHLPHPSQDHEEWCRSA